jgi:pilus assembly protein CpaB
MIAKSAEPTVNQVLKGSYARVPHIEGEPIRREKLVKTSGSGFVSAVLPAGMRAMSIPIDATGANTAGGFVLPNDRVDVMRTVRAGDASRAELVLSDVRVIAIGRNLQDPQGPDRAVQGSSATLEVSYDQARTLGEAQQLGSLFLLLRSLQDAGREGTDGRKDSLTIIRYGASVTLGR